MIKSNRKLIWELTANDAWITVGQSYAICPLDFQLKELKAPKGQGSTECHKKMNLCVLFVGHPCCQSGKVKSIYSRLGEQL